MGQTHVDIRIHGSFGSVVVSALADTAATFTKVPRSVFDEAGLVARYEAEVEIGDGRTIRRELALADVEIAGVRRPVLVSAGADGERPLVGYTTLETLGFKVNTVAHRLEATPPIEYGGVPPS
jgi:predicted aspartyl protease